MKEKNAYLTATPMQRETVLTLLGDVLAVLRAQALNYQTLHWQAQGSSAFGDHLLFERLYGSVLSQIDQLGEKLVGYLGSGAVTLYPQVQAIARYCEQWSAPGGGSAYQQGLRSEESLQISVQAAYTGIKAVGAMTLGLDDWLMATASAHEENTYLLQQASLPSGVTAHVKLLPPGHVTDEEIFFNPPHNREVREFAESEALTNDSAIAGVAAGPLDLPKKNEVSKAKEAPPTGSEIMAEIENPDISSLSRYEVETRRGSLQDWVQALTEKK